MKVLVLGGTGAMGRYLVPELLSMGCTVDAVSLDGERSPTPTQRTIRADCKAPGFLARQLAEGYDAVVDFMTYGVEEFRRAHALFARSGAQYIFLSTCRVYADDPVLVTEDSPRLLDVSADRDYLALAEREYSLFKAMQEDILRQSEYANWTIVRPATTYSRGRFQLVTLEASGFIPRTLAGKTVLLPREALDVQATLSWGGDAGRMIAHLVGNPAAVGQVFNICSAEHHSWREIAEYYTELLGLRYRAVDTETYLRCRTDDKGYPFARYQLLYARLFRRVTDNRKVLRVTGLRQESFVPLREGLARELAGTALTAISPSAYSDAAMDAYLARNS